MIQALIQKLKPAGEFSNRLKSRHRKFWSDPDAEAIRNTIMHATEPVERWKNGEHWQRKLSNKYNSREFARMHGCRVPELYWKGSNFSTINFNRLPAQYVIRPTIGHSSKLVFLMNNGYNMLDNQSYSVNDIKQLMADALAKSPRLEFMFEEFLRTEAGEYRIPNDYKIYCFNGAVACIAVINRLSKKSGFLNYYNERWEQINTVNGVYKKGTYQEPPVCLPEMLQHARLLSKAYEIFVRIDLYATDKGAVFGEFTPTPGRGGGYTTYGEKLLLPYWDTYCQGMI